MADWSQERSARPAIIAGAVPRNATAVIGARVMLRSGVAQGWLAEPTPARARAEGI